MDIKLRFLGSLLQKNGRPTSHTCCSSWSHYCSAQTRIGTWKRTGQGRHLIGFSSKGQRMKSCEGLLVMTMAVLSLSSPSTSRSLPQWPGVAEGVGTQEAGDTDLSPKDSPYWPSISGQVPPSWLSLGPREGRAENFIRFGRTHAEKNLANKKNNFIRLGRENPRQNNFIRLGRGGEDEPFFGSAWKWTTAEGNGSLREGQSDYGTAVN